MPPKPSSSPYWSRAGSFSGIDKLAQELGRDIAPMFRRFGLPPDVLADTERHVPYAAVAGLLEACALEWDCPDFGLRLARVQQLGTLGPVGLVARLSETVGGALKALFDHAAIHSTGFIICLDTADARTTGLAGVTYLPKPGAGTGRQKIELTMGVSRNVMATIAGMPGFAPARVIFACEPPADLSALRRYFRCPISHDGTHTTLLFNAALLDQPTAIHDAAYAPVIQAYLDQLGEPFRNDIVESTRRLIAQLLTTGRCTREVIAECLNLHPRTLQRRLAEQGTNFSALLDEHREALALDLVRRRGMPLAQVADVLGYADQSVFNQAFRRWTGTSPRRIGAA